MATAFDPYHLGGKPLANRIVMAPMTRSRAYGPGATPTDLMATYYAQRAGAGLIVTEGTQPSVVGQGYPDTPGLHSTEQVEAWRKVTDAVHDEGGVIFAQLMHTGRIGHPSLLPDDRLPVGPSAVAPQGQVFTHEGPKDFVTPKELTEAEIARTVDEFATAARNAVAAGFDGVEIHGA
ncbi:alkene reductase, partial [Streptomyces sp. MCAF7]